MPPLPPLQPVSMLFCSPQRLGLNVLEASGCNVVYVFLLWLLMTRLSWILSLCFSFNLMSMCMWVADDDLFSRSRLVCLKRDCFIGTVTLMLSATGLNQKWGPRMSLKWSVMYGVIQLSFPMFDISFWQTLGEQIDRRPGVCTGKRIVKQKWENHLNTTDTSDWILPHV